MEGLAGELTGLTLFALNFAYELFQAKLETLLTLSIYNCLKAFSTRNINMQEEIILIATFCSQSIKTSTVVLYIVFLSISKWPNSTKLRTNRP